MKKSVAFYVKLASRGGIETHVLNVAAAVSQAGHQPYILAKSLADPEGFKRAFGDVGAIIIGAGPGRARKLPRKFASILEILDLMTAVRKSGVGKFDTVSINAFGSAGMVLAKKTKPGGLATYHEHTFAAEGLQRASYKQLLARFDLVTVNSQRDLALVRPFCKRTECVPPLSSVEVPELTRREAQKPVRVAFVGNLSATQKGAPKLVDLWLSDPPEGCDLYLYGGGTIAREQDASESKHIHLKGTFSRSELSNVYAQTDLLVHPADDESFGLVLVEAMAHGVPFVATNIGGMADIGAGNPYVELCEDSLSAYRASICRMRDRILNNEIDRTALQTRYQQNYGPEVLGTRWVELYCGGPAK